MFTPVSSKVSFPKLEEEVLQLWKERKVFEKSLQQRQGGPLYVLYEGPPTANGSPGIHHVLARVFKDLFPRYKSMRGYYAPRKGGWDTHGLPVELEVERELKLSSKQEIERYGIAQFNQKCRESVFRYVKEWESLTERIAFWIDMEHAYVTYTNDYIETGWWTIKQLWNRGLLYEGLKVAPHCPRCVTTLSDHEVALGYEENVPDPSVYVKFEIDLDASSLPWVEPPLQGPVYLLAWTTTPWTLPGNTALAVAPDAEYALVRVEGQDGLLIMASALLNKALKHEYHVEHRFKGMELIGLRYKPLYDPFQFSTQVRRFAGSNLLPPVQSKKELLDWGDIPWLGKMPPDLSLPVLDAAFVSMEDGTGIVHIAPAFGQDDYEMGDECTLLFVQHVDIQGNIIGDYPFAGRFVKDADPLIMDDLKQRGLLYRRDVYRHTYPFCWRCGTPLLYYAKSSWYIRTTAVKERLMANNQLINWYPGHIKQGRFGEWLKNNVDWAISRERYWGTPLPLWRCDQCGHTEAVGSRGELKTKGGLQGWNDGPSASSGQALDLHRPFIDAVTYQCQQCSGTMRRLPEVIDCWFDSGAMPLAQWHYPFEDRERIEPLGGAGSFFPADYICEAIDQTRGWFYSLHALSTLLFDRPCFENVICLGLILDAKGEKMSKSKGNIVNPWSVINTHGADAVRWYLYSATPPGNSRRFSSDLVAEVVRQFLLPLWNTYAFFVTYANIDGFVPWLRLSLADALERFDVHEVEKGRATHERLYYGPAHELDRWLMSELQVLVKDVTASLEEYNPTDATRRIQAFVSDLSDWYVRRSRRRFWKSENDADKLSAHYTLYDCLVALSKLLAPMTPFLAESIYQNLARSVDAGASESVHLADWPAPQEELLDQDLMQATRLAVRLSSLGRAARQKANLRVRQPLQKALVKVRTGQERRWLDSVAEQVKEELNIKELAILEDESEVVEFQVKPNLKLLGPKYGRELNQVAAALAKAAPRQVAAQVAAGQNVQVDTYVLVPDEVLVSSQERPGYAAAMEDGYVVAITTGLSQELRDEGLARELVHRIQNMRRSAGLEITDRIEIYYQGNADLQRVMERHTGYIQQETLAEKLLPSPPGHGGYTESHTIEGQEVLLEIVKLA